MNLPITKTLAAAVVASFAFGTAQAATYDVTYTSQGPTGFEQASGRLTTNDTDGTVTALELPPVGLFFMDTSNLTVTSSYFEGDDLFVIVGNHLRNYFIVYSKWVPGALSGSFELNHGEIDNYKPAGWGTFVASEISPVPVPAAAPLLVAALGALGFAARRRKSA